MTDEQVSRIEKLLTAVQITMMIGFIALTAAVLLTGISLHKDNIEIIKAIQLK